jgi:hypothetical protein
MASILITNGSGDDGGGERVFVETRSKTVLTLFKGRVSTSTLFLAAWLTDFRDDTSEDAFDEYDSMEDLSAFFEWRMRGR